ncbi:MAG: TolC family protein, partial [Pseudomonadota bacterium]
MRNATLTCLLVLLCLASQHATAQDVTIALIKDDVDGGTLDLTTIFSEEINALLTGEFEVTFVDFPGDLTREGIGSAINDAEEDPDVDIILVTGLVANQLAIQRPRFVKPTFLPLVFYPELYVTSEGNASGINNLNFVRDRAELSAELTNLRNLVSYEHVGIVVDNTFPTLISELADYAQREAETFGVRFSVLGHTGDEQEVLNKLDPSIDAIMLADLIRFPDEGRQMIAQLTARGLPTYSLFGPDVVEMGALATTVPDSNWPRIGRRMALNIQAVLLGDNTGDQPLDIERREQLVINMATARALNYSPGFDILADARLINEFDASGESLGLIDAALLAVERNLSLRGAQYNVSIAGEQVREARGGLLPSIDASLSGIQRKEGPLVMLGQAVERTQDVAISLTQPLFVDRARLSKRLAEYGFTTAQHSLDATVLDTLLDATIAFINVHRAETNLRVQRENLNLTEANLDRANNRARVGAAGSADVYRWRSELANDRSAVIRAEAAALQAREALSALLNLPFSDRLQLVPPSRNILWQMEIEEFNRLVTNPSQFSRFVDYQADDALRRSPELMALNAQRDARLAELRTSQRSHWVPEISLSAQVSDNLDQTGNSPLKHEDDWQIAVSARYPLLKGGARKAETRRAADQVRQIELEIDALALSLRQRVRATIYDAYASYTTIDLAQESVESATRNLELITDAYEEGTISIIDLLDAQNAKVQADLGA